MSELRKEAEALGIEVDGRWSDKRLQKEIDAVKNPAEDNQHTEPEAKATGAKVRNTRGNLLDLKCCEITGFSEAELTDKQMADKRVQRAIEIGVLVEV